MTDRADREMIYVLGAGGHARVLLRVLRSLQVPVEGLVSPGGGTVLDIPVLGDDSFLDSLDPAQAKLVNGLGMVPGKRRRLELFEQLSAKGFEFMTVVHPESRIDSDVELAEGAQVLSGATIVGGAQIGKNAILNTMSIVDHDCRIGAGCHIAPGATLCGEVTLGDGVFVGAGAIVIQSVAIGEGALIGAGALVVEDVAPGARVYAAGRLP